MEGVGDILCTLDARDPTGTTEASIRLENERESPEFADRVAGLILGGHNFEKSVEYLPIGCQLRRIAALLVAFAAASSEMEGKPRRAEMLDAARTPTSAMLTTPSTPPRSVTACESDSQSLRSMGSPWSAALSPGAAGFLSATRVTNPASRAAWIEGTL